MKKLIDLAPVILLMPVIIILFAISVVFKSILGVFIQEEKLNEEEE